MAAQARPEEEVAGEARRVMDSQAMVVVGLVGTDMAQLVGMARPADNFYEEAGHGRMAKAANP